MNNKDWDDMTADEKADHLSRAIASISVDISQMKATLRECVIEIGNLREELNELLEAPIG